MSHRKLQQEVDKVFKKINEGLEIFDMYYERHESCTNNPSQKDKLESDLKREVKKLQRLREQIKSWQSSPDIKDKDTLLEHRKRVEIAMEQYKAVEKASKEKAYSNISLKKADTLDPESRERVETEDYLSQTIDELDRQHELLDVEIDKFQALNKKKKTHSQANEDKIKDFKALQLRYRWHQQRIELALRLLANEELSPQKVVNIKDDINFFVENNQEADFIEDDTIYDDLDLQSNEAIAHEVSQYYASQISEDNKRTGGDDEVETKPVILDTSRMSKKELRKLERDQKKAAKLAAKNAAAEMMSQGPTLTVKMGSKPLPPLEDLKPEEATINTTTTTTITSTKERTTINAYPKVKKVLESTPTKTQSTVKSLNTSPEVSSGNAVHTHIHQGINGVTGSTVLKPATIPAKPAGDMKWSIAASQNIKKEDEKPKLVFKQPTTSTPIQPNKIISNDATPTPSSSTTPRLATPVLSNNTVPLDKIGQLESLSAVQTNKSNASASSAVTAAAVLAAGAAAVNQNNQQFHKTYPVSLDQLNKLENTIKEDAVVVNSELNHANSDAEGTDDYNTNSPKPTSGTATPEEQLSESDFDKHVYYYYSDDDELSEEPQSQALSIEDVNIIDEKRAKLEESYNQNFDLLSLPNGINEFIMGYEITSNKLYVNDGKLGGYRHSIHTCKVPRLSEIPAGVNPPNPLDAFRSTQQWDTIRAGIHDCTDFDTILEKFRGLEMFSLFYNYYFSVLPIEKNIAFELLREKNWKVGNGETMWFLRQGDVKMQNESFEIADYKIFKLDDWSVVDKVNFRLDYANLKYPNILDPVREDGEGFESLTEGTNMINNNSQADSLSPKQSTSNTASPNSLSHGQQLLQQLKRGKMASKV